MNINDIPFITVSYNAPDLIENLIKSTRDFYPNKIYVIDGSDSEKSTIIKSITEKFDNTEFIGFDYNIHHGPGMAWAIQNLNLTGPVLFIDSDMRVLERGFLEKLYEALTPSHFGVGNVIYINEDGFTIDKSSTLEPVAYLHPALMLCNIEQMRNWPMPIKHGAPMTETMLEIHKKKNSKQLLHHLQWVYDVIENVNEKPQFVKHEGRGTVLRSNSYNLDEWMSEVQKKINSKAHKNNTIQQLPTIALDLGCGNTPRNPYEAQKLYGIDLLNQDNKDIIHLDLNTQQIPFADNQIDYITAFDLFRFIPKIIYQNQIKYPIIFILNEIWRTLKPNGYFLASFKKQGLANHEFEPFALNEINENHLKYFCRKDLNTIMDQNIIFQFEFINEISNNEVIFIQMRKS